MSISEGGRTGTDFGSGGSANYYWRSYWRCWHCDCVTALNAVTIDESVTVLATWVLSGDVQYC